MKRLTVIIAAAMAAFSVPAVAQGYVTDPNSVAVRHDFVISDGSRIVTTTPFLAHKDEDFTLVLYVMLVAPNPGRLDGWDWTLEVRVRYTNPSFGDGKTSMPFGRGDVFGMYVHRPYEKNYYIKETGTMSVRTEEWQGREWIRGSFRFDTQELIDLFNFGDVDMIGYTQGGSDPFAHVFKVSDSQFEGMMISSVLAILNRMKG